MTSHDDLTSTSASVPTFEAEARRASLVIGTIALGVAAFVGLFFTAVLNEWSQALALIVPVTLSVAAITTGPPRAAGRRLGWVALAVLATGIAAGLIHQGASGSYNGD
jgi:hypothetical protein